MSEASYQQVGDGTAGRWVLPGDEPCVLNRKSSPRLIRLLVIRPARDQLGFGQERNELVELGKFFPPRLKSRSRFAFDQQRSVGQLDIEQADGDCVKKNQTNSTGRDIDSVALGAVGRSMSPQWPQSQS